MVYVPVRVTHLRRVTVRGYLRHSFDRGGGIARLFRLIRHDEAIIIPQDSLLWGQAGHKTPPRWLKAMWSKLLGPFETKEFRSKRHFFIFWLGEKAQAAGFAWELLKDRRVTVSRSSTPGRRPVRISR